MARSQAARCDGQVQLFAPGHDDAYCDRDAGCLVMHIRDDHKAWTAAHESIMVWDHDADHPMNKKSAN